MTQKELREAIGLLTPYQVSELSKMTLKYLALNVELQETRPDRCPKCGVMQVIFHSYQSAEAWIVVLEDTLAMLPLDDTAYKLGVAHSICVKNCGYIFKALQRPRHRCPP